MSCIAAVPSRYDDCYDNLVAVITKLKFAATMNTITHSPINAILVFSSTFANCSPSRRYRVKLSENVTEA